MMGGADGVTDDNNGTISSSTDVVNDSTNATTEKTKGVTGNAPKSSSVKSDKASKLVGIAATATTDGHKKNGGAVVTTGTTSTTNTSSRGRKNKLIVTESTDAKKARVSVPSDSAKAASTTEASTEQALPSTTTSSRLSYPFDEMYAKLVAYKEEKGHCRVPQNYKDDRKLAAWVKNIRRNQKPGKIVDEKQIELLNAIGFQWESKAGRPVGATIEAGAKSPARKFRKPIEDDED